MLVGMKTSRRKSSESAPERRTDERSEAGRSGGADSDDAASPVPASEVSAVARRRHFSAEYKLRILDEVEAVRSTAGIGALLRREGLFFSHLATWRAQKEAGALAALAPRRRGPSPAPPNPLSRRVAELERENRNLQRRLAQSEAILEIQKKVSELLGIPLDPIETDGRTS